MQISSKASCIVKVFGLPACFFTKYRFRRNRHGIKYGIAPWAQQDPDNCRITVDAIVSLLPRPPAQPIVVYCQQF